jgi:hypothetical protein
MMLKKYRAELERQGSSLGIHSRYPRKVRKNRAGVLLL